MVSWVQGYEAGLADGGVEQVLPSEGSGAAFSQYVDNYCRAHPLQHVYDAARALALDISKKPPSQ